MRFASAFLLILLTTGCASVPPAAQEKGPLTLVKSNFKNLPDWGNENFSSFAQAYRKSCERILKRDGTVKFGPGEEWGTYANWQSGCKTFLSFQNPQTAQLKTFFETNFTPYEVRAGSKTEGLFTGYYESSLKGSRIKQGPYQYPLRHRPEDLVMVNLGEFREELKGQRIAGRVVGGNLKPYETHAEILAGDLPAEQDKPLVWVDSPVDAFFVQIQGSGIVELDDGSTMRIGYAGQNGHPYYAIGRELIKRGHLTQDNVSMQAIAGWLEKNPDQAVEVMTTNKSYVFFRELEGEGPEGGEGVALTKGRSLAIDRSIIPYGVPVWLDISHPQFEDTKIRRLMVTQDTGGAIRGPVRGDFFWGYGHEAEMLAGQMKSKGRYWFLLPAVQ